MGWQPMSTKWNVVFTAPGAIVVIVVEADDEESAIYKALEQAPTLEPRARLNSFRAKHFEQSNSAIRV